MFKVTVFNVKGFLKTVNDCTGAVNVVYPDGKKENINKDDDVQREMLNKYIANKKCLQLTLDIPNPKDYFSIVFFSCGDC